MPAVMTAVPTLQHIERKARTQFIWTAEHLLKILPKDAPVSPLRLNWPQRYLAENYLIPAHQRGLPLALSILKARREGVSTLVGAWHFHKVRWYRGRRAMVYAHDDDTLSELFDMITRFHDYLPDELRIPTSANNTKELEYAGLDSRIGRRVAGHKDVGRGKTIHHAHLSEVDFYDDPVSVMAGVVEAVPTTGPSTLILETTANGDGGYFHEHWKSLLKRKGKMFSNRYWFPVFLPWFWHPDHSTVPPRDWAPTKEEGELQRRYGLQLAQIFWRHQKGQELETLNPGRGKKLLVQEYPSNPTEAFIQSGDCIFSQEGMEAIEGQVQAPTLGWQPVRAGDKVYRLDRVADPLEAALQVWEPPQPGYHYALGVDVAHGTGGDDSACCVMRMPGFRVVAEWYDNFTSPRQLAYVVAAIARYYASNHPADLPYVNVEINDAGLLTNDELNDMAQNGEPFQLYLWEPFDRLAAPKVTGATRTGWLTTHISKNVLIGVANSILGEMLAFIPSASLQHEMHRTIEVRAGIVATRGADQVMAWLFALVTCYRKIARWDWPGMGMALHEEDEEQAPRRITNPACQDTTAGRLFERPSREAAWDELGGGEARGHWLVG